MDTPQQLTTLGMYGGPSAFYGGALVNDMNFVLPLAGPAPVDFTQVFPSMVCRVADEGVRTIVEVVDSDQMPVNVRGATVLQIKYLKPSGETYDATASFLTNGYDGKIYFASTDVAPPFDEAGVWFIQVKLVIDDVQQSTKWGCFAVQPNIDDA